MFDLALASSHHLLIFGLFGILIAELLLVRPGVDVGGVRQVARIDLWYGGVAAVILTIGFSRAIFAAKGWPYYQHNAFFWAKITTFLLLGLFSVPPTLAYLRWNRVGVPPTVDEVRRVRAYLLIEILLFALLPLFAAAMARGYGADAF